MSHGKFIALAYSLGAAFFVVWFLWVLLSRKRSRSLLEVINEDKGPHL